MTVAVALPTLNDGDAVGNDALGMGHALRRRGLDVLFFADNDERINAAWPAYDEALKTAGVKHEAFKYPGTQHGFNNDTTPRFDAAAAQQAWERTLGLFNRTLR